LLHVFRKRVRPDPAFRQTVHCIDAALRDAVEVAPSSPEELTLVVGRLLRPIVFILDVVR
jgi:hypothetical protein